MHYRWGWDTMPNAVFFQRFICVRRYHEPFIFFQKGKLVMDLDDKTYAEIAKMIHSDQSPVGIDAKKTHIYIIHMLKNLEKRLETIEQQVSR